jgi:hypothetical protein
MRGETKTAFWIFSGALFYVIMEIFPENMEISKRIKEYLVAGT